MPRSLSPPSKIKSYFNDRQSERNERAENTFEFPSSQAGNVVGDYGDTNWSHASKPWLVLNEKFCPRATVQQPQHPSIRCAKKYGVEVPKSTIRQGSELSQCIQSPVEIRFAGKNHAIDAGDRGNLVIASVEHLQNQLTGAIKDSFFCRRAAGTNCPGAISVFTRCGFSGKLL